MPKRKKLVDIDCEEKTKFEIDWEEVMDENRGDEEEELPELEVIVTKPQSPPVLTALSEDQMNLQTNITDSALDEQLERNRSLLVNLGPKLPDKGERIRSKIASLVEEKQRRALRRARMDVNGCRTLKYSTGSGYSDVVKQENTASTYTSRKTDLNEVSRSTFADFFCKSKTDTQSIEPFGKELEDLGCESRNHKTYKNGVKMSNDGWMLSKVGKSKHSEKQFYCGFKGSKGNQKSKESYGKKSPKESSPYSLFDDDDNDSETPRARFLQESPSLSTRRRKKSDSTVINVDEEEPQSSTVVEQTAELPEGLQEEICYPSRDDPDFVQVCLKDLECLAPREFLSSTVMNFYIRFLQQQVSSANQISADCHFFNTYFYKKLNDAVRYKGNDKDAFFVKFRRWWKGTDLFRKAYIFIPIHEDLHWSLVIVCIPDKEDESGLTILHLDSLGLHSRRSIVENVKRFLRDEWNYLNQVNSFLDLPVSEKIWKHLPRRISEADIQVPQQKNDFDCGPFVLFFIKRFIEEAPRRLKRTDLGMFDKRWFRPDEASALRTNIRNTLIDLFRVSNQTDCDNDQTGQTDQTCIEQRISDDKASVSRHSSPL